MSLRKLSHLTIGVLIFGIACVVVISLRYDIPHALLAGDQTAIDYAVVLPLFLVLLTGTISLLYMRNSISNRLRLLNQDLEQIASSGDPQARMHVGAQDELSRMAQSVNQLLDILAQDRKLQAENADWFQMLVEQSPTGVYFITEKLFVYVNQSAASMFGFQKEDIDWGASPLDMIHPDDRDNVERLSLAFNNSEAQEILYTMRGLCQNERVIHCAVHERRVIWKGRPSTLGIVTDVTDSQLAHDKLLIRDEILEAVSVAASRFLKGNDWEEDAQEVLQQLGKAARVSHACIFKNHTLPDGTLAAARQCSWVVSTALAPISPAGTCEFRYSGDSRADWEEKLARGHVVMGNAKGYPDELNTWFASAGIQAVAAVPVFVNQRWWGIVGLADCYSEHAWSTTEEGAMQLFASLLGAAIERNQHVEQVKRLYDIEYQRRKLAEALFDSGTALSATLDFDSILDLLLEQVQRIVPYDMAFILLVQEGQAYVARVRHCQPTKPSVLDDLYGVVFEVSKTANLRWMAENGQPLVIPDTSYYPGYMTHPGLEAIGSWVQAPIMSGGVAIGFLFLGNFTSNTYNADTSAYVAPFASQASFALQNARLYANASDALSRERRYNDIVRTVNSSLDLPVVLRNVAHLANDLAKADAVCMGLLNESGQLAMTTYTAKPVHQIPETHLAQDKGLAWNVMRTRHSLVVTDYPGHPDAQPDWVSHGVQTVIASPIIAGDVVLGVLEVLSFTADKHFDDIDVLVAEAVGQQAGLAIQKARLLEDASRRAQEAETLRQAGAAVTSTLHLHETFERILEQLARVVPYDTASVQLLHQGYLEIVDGHGWRDRSKVMGVRFYCPGDNPNTQVIQTRKPVLLSHAMINDEPTGRCIQSWLGVPLIFRDQVIGMLTLDCFEPDHFHTDHIRLASAFADQVAVAIENARLFEKVQQLAMTDELTGIYNRRRFFELAEQALEHAQHNGRALSVLMIDIDQFKRVNDTFGHLAGDQVLRVVAQRCRAVLHPTDLLARYGGEEFVALLHNTSPAEALKIAECLRNSVGAEPVMYHAEPISVAVSVGVAHLDQVDNNLETLLIRADEAQYMAKKSGGNRLVTWQSV